MQDYSSAILELVPDDAEGATTEWICRRLGVDAQALGDSFERLRLDGKLFGLAGVWLTPKGYEVGAERFVSALSSYHDEHPDRILADPLEISNRAELRWKGKPLRRAASKMAEQGRIAYFPEGVRAIGFRAQLPVRQREFLGRVLERIESQPVDTPNPFEISRQLSAPQPAVEEIVRIGVLAGEIVQLTDSVYYTPRQLEVLSARLAGIRESDEFTASRLRDELQTSRKYAVAILRHFHPRED
jgi:selenocysteine-specific elongation factor